MTGKNDDAAGLREDSFLGGLVPQVTERLAGRHAADFDAEAGLARFHTWLDAHTAKPAAAAEGRKSTGYAAPTGTRRVRRSRNRRPGAWDAVPVPGGGFLVWLSGARRQILAECPIDRPKYAGLGAAMLISAVVAGVSSAFALAAGLSASLWVTLPSAFAWGAIILSLNRLFVVSLPRGRSGLAQLLRATPRVLLALLLGFVISTPIVLQIFQPDINAQIAVIQQEDTGAYYRQLATSPLQLRINKDQATVTALETQAATGGPGVDVAQDAELNVLKARLDTDQAQANYWYKQMNCQLYGSGNCTSGTGPLFTEAQRSYNAEKAQISQLNSEIQAREQYLTETSATLQAGTKAEAAAALPAAKQALHADLAEEQTQTGTFLVSNQKNDGLLIRLQALDAATAGNSTLNAARWLLFLLFVSIDCMPVLIKAMLNLGPETTYDKLLEQEEKMQLRAAEHNRALRLRSQMMEAEAQAEAEQAALAAWKTNIPWITQEVTEARTRVAKRNLYDWERDQTQRPVKKQATAPDDPLELERPVSFPGWPWIITSPEKSGLGWWHPRWPRNRRTPESRPYGAPFSPSMPGEQAQRTSSRDKTGEHSES